MLGRGGLLAFATMMTVTAVTSVAVGATIPTVERTPITGLAGKPLSRAVLEAYMPQLLGSPRYNDIMWLTLRELQKFDPRLTNQLLTSVDGALAQTAAAPTVASTPIFLLAARPETRAVLDAEIPGLLSRPQYPKFKYISLKALQAYDNQLTDDGLSRVQSALDSAVASAKGRK